MDLNTLISKSKARLDDPQLHGAVRERAYKLIEAAYKIGINIIITQGYRSKEYQNGLYAQGRTKPGNIVTNVKGGYSYHNYGLAVDFAVVTADGKTVVWDTTCDLNKNKHRDWFEVGELGEKLGFEWGGRWQGFVDNPHLQLTFGLTVNQLYAGKRPPAYVPTPQPPVTQPAQKPVDPADTPCSITLDSKVLDVKGFLDGHDSKSYLPVRVIAEILGHKVDFKDGLVIVDTTPLKTSRVVGGTGYAHSRELGDAVARKVAWVNGGVVLSK